MVTVCHGEDAAELDRHCVLGDATLLARRHGMHDVVVWLGPHSTGISKTMLDVLNSSVDEYGLAEWRLETPLHLFNTVTGERRRGTRGMRGLAQGS